MSFNTATGRAEYVSGASQTQFNFSFKIFQISDIIIYKTLSGVTPDETNDLLVLGTDYTVTINGDNGGFVTLLVAASVGDLVTLRRSLDINRFIEFQTKGDLTAEALNEDQEYQTYLSADRNDDNSRALTFQESQQTVDNKIPSPSAGAYLKWKVDETGFENDNTIPASVAAVEANAIAAGISETNSQLSAWEAEAEALTADNYANTPHNVFVDNVTSDGDGTFTSTPTTDYSSLHWSVESANSSQDSAINVSYDDTSTDAKGANVQVWGEDLDTIVQGKLQAFIKLSGSLNSSIIAGLYSCNGVTDYPATRTAGMLFVSNDGLNIIVQQWSDDLGVYVRRSTNNGVVWGAWLTI